MQIRLLEPSDIPDVARLLRDLAREFIVHESPAEGASTFLRENDEDGIRGYLARGYVYHVAVVEGRVAGFIAVRDRNHIFHLFVGLPWQRQGLARRLWDTARAAALDGGVDTGFTVNASNHAVRVYESFGFVRTAPMQCLKGVYFNPMRLVPAAS